MIILVTLLILLKPNKIETFDKKTEIIIKLIDLSEFLIDYDYTLEYLL